MKNKQHSSTNNNANPIEQKESRDIAMKYMKTLVEVARESFLILDPKLKIVSANPLFYQTFRVSNTETEGKFLYDLGDGQWNIPKLKRLLEEILPKKHVVRNYNVKHDFEKIGQKTMLLNARQIDSVQLIILAVEDITIRKNLEEKLAKYTKGLEAKVTKRTADLADRIKELERMNKIMVGREMKMIELKSELEKLKKSRKKSR